MMIRRFDPGLLGWAHFRDKVIMMDGAQFKVEDVGMAQARLPFDEDVVDLSGAMLELTTHMMLSPMTELGLAVFTSRRWRNHRWNDVDEEGYNMEWPTEDDPLLFIGNPVILTRSPDGITVHREPSYLIKSGAQVMSENPSD